MRKRSTTIKPNESDLRRRLAEPKERAEAAIEVGDWVRDLCLLFGASFDTSVTCGALFSIGVERSWSEGDGNGDNQAG